ncbi:hypothetical protein BDQ12DRAFT_712299 [Crucibulum laeve]|uniref:Uncharacterized protein n=1 Tax=Crucibulum laeve TaxID=68775 RepID=A0A5C3M412_9AGAR|nr:hypothetical protein BDQ12DRAFT_712299 [Crucibulum laeve]
MNTSTTPKSLSEIDSIIHERKNALMILPERSDTYLDILEELGELYIARFRCLPQSSTDLDEAIDLLREFCRICPPSNRLLLASYKFSGLLEDRACPAYRLKGVIYVEQLLKSPPKSYEDLDESVLIQENALGICPKDHEYYKYILGRLGSALLVGREHKFQRGAQLIKDAIKLYPAGHSQRFILLLNHAEILSTMIAASDTASAQAEIDELIMIYKEIIDDTIGLAESPKPGSTLLVDCGRWLTKLCESPLNCTWRAKDLILVAEKLFKLGQAEEAKLLLARAEVIQDPKPLSSYAMQHDQLDHEYYLSCLKNVPSCNTMIPLKAIYGLSTNMISTNPESAHVPIQTKENLQLLCNGLSNQHDRLAVYLNLSTLYQRQSSLAHHREIQYLNSAIDYQRAALQIITPDHDFYSHLLAQLTNCLAMKFNITDDIIDFKKYVPPKGMMGPYIKGSPWEPTVTPVRIMPSPESNSLSYIESLRKFLNEKRNVLDIRRLVEALYSHCEQFYPKDTIYLSEISELINEAKELDPSIKFQRGLNAASLNLAWYHQSGELKYLKAALNHEPVTVAHIKALYEQYLDSATISDLKLAIKYAQTYEREQATQQFLSMCLLMQYQYGGNVDDLKNALHKGSITESSEAYLCLYQRFGQSEDLAHSLKVVDPETLDYDHNAGYGILRRSITYCEALLEKYNLQNDIELLAQAKNVVQNSKRYSPYPLYPRFLHLEVYDIYGENSTPASIQNKHI